MASNANPAPAVPQGWEASWSAQYNQWFYVDQKSGNSQWEHPSHLSHAPPPTTSPDHAYNAPMQPQYPQQTSPPPPTTSDPGAATDRGIMSKIAVGSGLAAGAYLKHEYAEHHHQAEQHNLLGSMASLIGASGAGALGAKFFGRKDQTPPQQQQQHQHQPAPPPPAMHYPPAPQPLYHPGPPAGPGYPYPTSSPSYPMPSASPPVLAGANNHPPHPVALPFSAPMQAHPSAGPQLRIHAATFADADVTDRVRRLVSPTQELIIAKMADEFGDPWPEAKRKAFSVLYQFGERPMEVWCGNTEDSGAVEIRNEALSNARMAFVNKDPGRIICLIWGQRSVLSQERTAKLEKEGELDCSGLGDGGFWAWEIRNLICFYRMEDGRVGIGHGREGGTLRLPWNPLARWS